MLYNIGLSEFGKNNEYVNNQNKEFATGPVVAQCNDAILASALAKYKCREAIYDSVYFDHERGILDLEVNGVNLQGLCSERFEVAYGTAVRHRQ